MAKVVSFHTTATNGVGHLNTDAAKMSVKAWAARGGIFDLLDDRVARKFRLAFAIVLNSGREIEDYRIMHHYAISKSLVTNEPLIRSAFEELNKLRDDGVIPPDVSFRARKHLIRHLEDCQKTTAISAAMSDENLIEAVGGGEAEFEPVAASESGPRKFNMFPAYSGGKLHVGAYTLPVVADIGGIEWDRLPKIRRNHDVNQMVGHATSVDIIDRGGKSELHVSGVVSAATAVAEEVVASAAQGFPWQSSVTLQPLEQPELVRAGKKFSANGQDFEGPAYFVKKSKLIEVSFVDIGGDASASAEIAASIKKDESMSSRFEEYLVEAGFDAQSLEAGQLAALQAAFDAQEKKSEKIEPVAATSEFSSDQRQELQKTWNAERAEAIEAQSQISALCKQYDSPKMELDGKEVPIEAAAIKHGWDLAKTELELIRAARPTNASIHSNDSASDPEVVEAALCVSSGALSEGDLGNHYSDVVCNEAVAAKNRQYSLHSLMYDTIRASGGSSRPGVVNDSVIRDALAADSALIQANFSTISLSGTLGNVANKSLKASFGAPDATLDAISSSRDVNDFKSVSSYRISGIGKLEELGPSGELQHMNLEETSYSNQAKTYARMLGLTRQMMINDDLGAFANLAGIMGQKARVTFNRVGFTQFLDDAAFFTAARNNLISGASSALDIGSLSLAEQQLVEQTDEDGDPINSMGGSILLAAPAIHNTARQLVRDREVNETTTANKPKPVSNPHAGKNWKAVTSAYVGSSVGSSLGATDTNWWLLEGPAAPVLEIVYLRGNRAPTVSQADTPINFLGRQWSVVFDFGFAHHEYRGGVKSAGA